MIRDGCILDVGEPHLFNSRTGKPNIPTVDLMSKASRILRGDFDQLRVGSSWESKVKTGIEPRDGKISLVSAFVGSERINGISNLAILLTKGVEKDLVGWPDSRKTPCLDGDTLFCSKVAHNRNSECCFGYFVRFDRWSI